jgi:membrane peptidoglycan carboxypeptidase
VKVVGDIIAGTTSSAPTRSVRRGLRRIWTVLRVPLIAGLIAAHVLLEAALVMVWAIPFDPASLRPRGEPLVILDRRGRVLTTVANPGGTPDRDHWVALGDIPAVTGSAVVESEDAGFWDHRGVDGRGIARAAWLDLRAGRTTHGGSTLTMQLARMLAPPGRPRTWTNKLREALLALRIERAVDKRTILEQWLNRADFGRGAHGIDAAAELYFGKPATSLSTGEAVLLAIVPRAPAAYDPIEHLGAARRHRDRVLDLLVRRGVLSPADARTAEAEPLEVSLHRSDAEAPLLAAWVLGELPDDVRARGGIVHTTLDAPLEPRLAARLFEIATGLRVPGPGAGSPRAAAITRVDVGDGSVWRPAPPR